MKKKKIKKEIEYVDINEIEFTYRVDEIMVDKIMVDKIKLIFKDVFLEALYDDTISIKNDNICMEKDKKIYEVDLKAFASKFKQYYQEYYLEMLKYVLEGNCGILNDIYLWTNPIIDKLPIKLETKDELIKAFKEKLNDDKIYYNKVREYVVNITKDLNIEDRKKYIDRFIGLGVLEEQDKIELQYYADYDVDKLKELFNSEIFNSEKINEEEKDKNKIKILSQMFVHQRSLEKNNNNNSKHNRRIIEIVKFLPSIDILDIFLEGKLKYEEFIRAGITKEKILEAPFIMLLQVLVTKNNSLPKNLKITSRDLINSYGRNLTGTNINELVICEFINPEDMIEIFEINKALEKNKGYEDFYTYEELMAYYTPSRLIDMRKSEVLNPRFVELYRKLMDFDNNPELFKYKSEKLVEELKNRIEYKEDDTEDKKEDLVQDEILYFFNIGLCDVETAKENIPEVYIEKKFINNEITIEEVFNYFNKGLISNEAISNYYDDNELLEMYQNSQTNIYCLRAIKDVNLIIESFCDEKISDSDFIGLYLNGRLSIDNFELGIQLSEREVDISNFIDENVPFEKIKELFSKYLIDYATLLILSEQGLLNSSQLKEIKDTVSTREFFNDLNKGKIYTVVTNRQNHSTTRRGGTKTEKDENDFSNEIELISQILRKDISKEKSSLIESYNLKGKPTSLNNYSIFGSEELDGIIILQKSKKGNAVYVMSVYQLMYFLHGEENAEGQIEIKDRMKDKAYLRTIEGVSVVEHKENFARNLVEAISKISPKIAQKIKGKDNKYIEEVDFLIEEMRNEYLKEKGISLDD